VAAEIASIVRPAGQAGKAAAGAAAKAGGGQAGTATEAGAIPAAGVLEGEALLDGDFDRQALSLSLASDAPVVHIASHFRLSPAGHEATELLLGDGSTLTLRKIKTDPSLDFKGLDLLTLSACDTASGAGRDGKEVESFGEVVQRAGASAVLASLWPVSDASTALLMREFYRLRYVEGRNKAEALREAQLSVMAGSPAGPAAAGRAAISAAGASSAAGPAGAAPQSAPAWTERGFSHPFYWAPFILMGNWR
jgi:CHAT domain-containing protein